MGRLRMPNTRSSRTSRRAIPIYRGRNPSANGAVRRKRRSKWIYSRINSKTQLCNVPELEFFGGEAEKVPTFYADETESEVITFNAAGAWTATVTDSAGNVPAWIEVSASLW